MKSTSIDADYLSNRTNSYCLIKDSVLCGEPSWRSPNSCVQIETAIIIHKVVLMVTTFSREGTSFT